MTKTEDNVWIVEIMCATGYKVSDICYANEDDAYRWVRNQTGHIETSIYRRSTMFPSDGNVYRVRPLILRYSLSDSHK
jgi:hypothetical protein